jgi:hypothetical protein
MYSYMSSKKKKSEMDNPEVMEQPYKNPETAVPA